MLVKIGPEFYVGILFSSTFYYGFYWFLTNNKSRSIASILFDIEERLIYPFLSFC